MGQGIPKPESEGRAVCRVELCGEPCGSLVVLDPVARIGEAETAALANHGFCTRHLRAILPTFVRRWEGTQNQAALERLWRTIADDLTIEEARRG